MKVLAAFVGLCLDANALAADAFGESAWEAGFRYESSTDASPVNNFNVPQKLGWPHLSSQFVGGDLGWRRRGRRFEHRVRLAGHWPGHVRFDDGSGKRQVVGEQTSQRFDLTASYHLDWYVLQRRRISLALGGIVASSYDRSQLDYGSAGVVRSWDWSNGLGLSTVVTGMLAPRLRARLEIDNVAYLPWLGVGRVTRLSRTEAYGPMMVASSVSLALGWRARRSVEIEAGWARQDELFFAQPAGYALEFENVPPLAFRFRNRDSLFLRLRKRIGRRGQ